MHSLLVQDALMEAVLRASITGHQYLADLEYAAGPEVPILRDALRRLTEAGHLCIEPDHLGRRILRPCSPLPA